ETAVDFDRVDVLLGVFVGGQELLAAEDEGCIARFGDVGQVGGVGAGARREQVDAATVGGAVGARVGGAAAARPAGRRPLIDVAAGPASAGRRVHAKGAGWAARFPVDIGGNELVGALEEEAVAVRREVATEEVLDFEGIMGGGGVIHVG